MYRKDILYASPSYPFRDLIPGPHNPPIPFHVVRGAKEGHKQTVQTVTIHVVPISIGLNPITDEVLIMGLTGWESGYDMLEVRARIPKGEDEFAKLEVDTLPLEIPKMPPLAELQAAKRDDRPIWIKTIPGNGRISHVNMLVGSLEEFNDQEFNVLGRTSQQQSKGYLEFEIWRTFATKPRYQGVLRIPFPENAPGQTTTSSTI